MIQIKDLFKCSLSILKSQYILFLGPLSIISYETGCGLFSPFSFRSIFLAFMIYCISNLPVIINHSRAPNVVNILQSMIRVKIYGLSFFTIQHLSWEKFYIYALDTIWRTSFPPLTTDCPADTTSSCCGLCSFDLHFL